jgi:hypothetical protein
VSRKKRHNRPGRRDDRDPQEELYGFLRQKNISALNIERIKFHLQRRDAETRALAEVTFEIARVHPHSRKRLSRIAAGHWPLFVRMVATLADVWWDRFSFDYRSDDEWRGWLYERVQEAQYEIWSLSHGAKPCHCGSGELYRNCCAQRDELSAQKWAQEEYEREEMSSPYPFPWWHPESDIDYMTRSAYQMYYAAGEDHPLALTPPEMAL